MTAHALYHLQKERFLFFDIDDKLRWSECEWYEFDEDTLARWFNNVNSIVERFNHIAPDIDWDNRGDIFLVVPIASGEPDFMGANWMRDWR